MKNINELKAFTDQQLRTPLIRTIAQNQLGRLRQIAADHNAMPSSTRKPGYAQRIHTMLRTRGAHAALEPSLGREPDIAAYKHPIITRQDIPRLVHHDTVVGTRDLSHEDREKASRHGAVENRARHKGRRDAAKWDLGVADAVGRGFTRPYGISEENNMMNIKQYYKQILNSAINEATPAEIQAHQIARLDRIGNRFNGGEFGADLRTPRNRRAGERIANLYKKAGVMGGWRPYSGLAGSDPVMLRLDTWPAHPKAIANANAALKRDRGSNRTVGEKIRGFIKRTRGFVKRTTGLEEMNQVDEMALTMNEATPAEIQAHQISRLDRIADKFDKKGGAFGADLSKHRNLQAAHRIHQLYKTAGVMGGWRPYSGQAGDAPAWMRANVSPADAESIEDAKKYLKGVRGKNRTVGEKIRGFIKRTRGFVKRTTGLEEMNQVDEMALTKNAYRKMLQGVNDAQDRGDATSGNKSALHWRDHEKKSIALVKALKSPKLFDIGPKGGLVQIGRLKGSKDPARDITYGANFRHMRGKSRIPTEVTRSARELAKLHGMFYTTHPLGDEDVTNPLGKTVAIGGRRGPLDPFYRIASSAARYDN